MTQVLSFLWKVVPTITTLYSIYKQTRRITMNDEEKKLVAEAVAKLKGDASSLKNLFSGVKTLREAISLVPEVVHQVEQLSGDVKMAGSLKKEVAIQLLNDLIDVPYVPESLEAIIFGYVIDAVVAAYNKYGKGWIEKLLPTKAV